MSYSKLTNTKKSTYLKFKYCGFILIFLLTLSSSCSNSENDCLREKSEIINKFNELIRLAGDDDDAQKASLIRQRDEKLRQLDC